MEAREYLDAIRKKNLKVRLLMDELANLQTVATSMTSPMGLRVCSTHNPHRLEDVIIRITEVRQEIDEEIYGYIGYKRAVIITLSHIKSEKQRKLLYDKYVDGKKMKDIIKESGTTPHNIKRMHKAALTSLHNILSSA